MAGLLETVILPRASALPSASLVPVVGSTSVRFSNFSGLKIQPTRPSVKLSSTRKARVGSRIVCEAQDTAVEDSTYCFGCGFFEIDDIKEVNIHGSIYIVEDAPPAVTDSNWQSLVLESDLPVLVEFWAPWCGPCRMIHPVIDKLAQQYAGKLKVYKVNTDESPSIATQYGIRSIPTVIVFKNGEKKDAVIGAVPESTLTTCLEKFL